MDRDVREDERLEPRRADACLADASRRIDWTPPPTSARRGSSPLAAILRRLRPRGR